MNSIQINVLYSRRANLHRHLHPLLAHKKQLKELGLKICFFESTFAKSIFDCDVLVLFEGGYRKILPIHSQDRNSSLSFLEPFLANFKKVIWFDDSDSSGNLRKYIFPHATLYAKAQMMRNRGYYLQEAAGAPHFDYVIRNFDVSDCQTYKGQVTETDMEKLRVGWNLALVNWGWRYSNSLAKPMQDYIPYRRKLPRPIPPNLAARSLDVTCRVGKWESVPPVNWWRTQTLNCLGELKHFNVRSEGAISFSDYTQELKNSVVCVSPFGVGEICYRDFECFIQGALLVKPSMNHLETFPDLFVEGETYVSHSWDFSDFREQIDLICSNPNRYEEIAREGQRRFVSAVTDGEAFARHFESLVKST